MKSPSAQDQFRPMPGLISCAGVTGSGCITYHVYATLLSGLKISPETQQPPGSILYTFCRVAPHLATFRTNYRCCACRIQTSSAASRFTTVETPWLHIINRITTKNTAHNVHKCNRCMLCAMHCVAGSCEVIMCVHECIVCVCVCIHEF